ncbi:hypothetical protein ACIPWI_13640 [Streptomyces sp. NPDC090046]|uniref:hypothetical protein n=1 Tax=Streptomyces sp. NPDC090046 TaxID=3365928 RepID=UPI00382D56DA
MIAVLGERIKVSCQKQARCQSVVLFVCVRLVQSVQEPDDGVRPVEGYLGGGPLSQGGDLLVRARPAQGLQQVGTAYGSSSGA